MDLSFSTQEVRRICKNLRSANRKLGAACATFLHDRLADIDAAQNGSDLKLLPGLFYLDDADGTVRSALGACVVLEAVVGPSGVMRTTAGHIDWQEVVRLKVVEVRGTQ